MRDLKEIKDPEEVEEPPSDDDDSSVAGSEDSLSIGGDKNNIDYIGGSGDEDEEEEDNDDDNGSIKSNQEDDIIIPSTPGSDDEEDEDEDDEEEDENYLQKLDDHVRKKVIEDHHPELKTLNYEEVEALATVIRDKNNNIIDNLHRTLPMMTRYEKARILGERARQINAGAKPMIEVEPTLIDGYLIALKELEQKRVPFIIQRPMPNGGSEYWRVADLE